MLYYLTTALYVFVCLVLLMVILLQQGKGGDMASAFGGGSSQTAFGARGGATLLSKITAAFAALFMLGALTLAIIGERDHYTPPDDVDALEATGVTIVSYPEAEHGFAHAPERPAHRPDDAADAFARARAWLTS